MCSGLPFCCLGWVKGPGVSKPSSRLGCVVNKGGSAAASDGAHLVVSRQRSSLRFGLTTIDRLCPLAAIVVPSRTAIRVIGWALSRSSIHHRKSLPFGCHPSPVAPRGVVFPDGDHSRRLSPFFRNFCVIFMLSRPHLLWVAGP